MMTQFFLTRSKRTSTRKLQKLPNKRKRTNIRKVAEKLALHTRIQRIKKRRKKKLAKLKFRMTEEKSNKQI